MKDYERAIKDLTIKGDKLMLDAISVATLVGKKCKYVGYATDSHPTKAKWLIRLTFYHIESDARFVICVSEMRRGDFDKNMAKSTLGCIVPGEVIMRFVQRNIEPIEDYKSLIDSLKDIYMDSKWFD